MPIERDVLALGRWFEPVAPNWAKAGERQTDECRFPDAGSILNPEEKEALARWLETGDPKTNLPNEISFKEQMRFGLIIRSYTDISGTMNVLMVNDQGRTQMFVYLPDLFPQARQAGFEQGDLVIWNGLNRWYSDKIRPFRVEPALHYRIKQKLVSAVSNRKLHEQLKNPDYVQFESPEGVVVVTVRDSQSQRVVVYWCQGLETLAEIWMYSNEEKEIKELKPGKYYDVVSKSYDRVPSRIRIGLSETRIEFGYYQNSFQLKPDQQVKVPWDQKQRLDNIFANKQS